MGFQGGPKALPFGEHGKRRVWSRKTDDRNYRLLYGVAVVFTWCSAKHAKKRTRNSKIQVVEASKDNGVLFWNVLFDKMTFLACGSWHSNRVDIQSIFKCEKT